MYRVTVTRLYVLASLQQKQTCSGFGKDFAAGTLRLHDAAAKDTLHLVLGQLLDLTGGALHLLCHHKQEVGVVYPLGVNQPARRHNSA